MKRFSSFYAFVGVLLGAVYSKAYGYNVQDFQLKEADLWVQILFVSIILLIIGVVVFLAVKQSRQRAAKLKEHADRNFTAMARQFNLTQGEVLELKRLVRKIIPHQPDAVFSSLGIFEEAVEAECKSIRHKWGMTTKAENATLALHTLRNKIGFNNIAYEQPIASTRNLDVGQFIQIQVPGSEQVAIEQAVVSENNELAFTVHYPVGDEKISIASIKQPLVNFTRNGDGYYTASLDVVAAFPSDGKVVFEHTRQINRNQMRKYVRMVVDISLKCRVLRRGNKGALPAVGQFLEGTTIVDIGGGGVAFVAEQELDPEDTISLVFAINKRKFAVKGLVVAVNEQEGRKGTRFKHRVSFIDVDPGDVERIVKFIFQKQREQVQMLSGRKAGA